MLQRLVGPDLPWGGGTRAECVVVLFDEMVERGDEDLRLGGRVQSDETLEVAVL